MKIRRLEISSFRGIPDNVSILFPLKNNKPASLIILGDNGVGKSSIVDSVELCLQGQILQSKRLDSSTAPSIKSFHSQQLPNIKITLENGEVIDRSIIEDEQGLLSDLKYPHQLFSISPFVLRRHDILRFIDSAEAERTLVFSNYLRDHNNRDWVEHPIDELKRLQDERLKHKNRRDSLLKSLADELKIDIKLIPLDRKQFFDFVKVNIYKGFSKADLEAKGFKVKLNERAVRLSTMIITSMDNHKKIKNEINNFSVVSRAETFPKHLLTQLEEVLTKVSQKLTSSFLQISPLPFIDKIEIKYDIKSVLALSLLINLKNEQVCTPNQILSEANLDLLALLFFLSFIEESAERGQAKFIILDDVLQSIDATIRVSFISYLLKNLPDWQYIITAHDRLWHRQLQELMNLHNHSFFNLSITGWSFEKGPEIKSTSNDLDEILISALNDKNLIQICSASGLLLEELSDGLSKSLRTSIQRKRDDRYTLADLLPGIFKVLKRTDLKTKIEPVEQWLHLRNLIGAHFNDWAMSLSLEEAKQFGESVKALFNETKCKKCSQWITDNPDFSFYSCKCGSLIIQKKSTN